MHRLPDPDLQPEFYDGVAMKRLMAWMIDAFLVTVCCVLIVIFTVGIAAFFWPFMWLTISFIYRVITISNGSATWGMRMMSIELRDQHDAPLDRGLAFFHTLGYTLSIGTFLVQLVSMVLMATSARCQGLSDLVLGTTALNRRRR